MERGVDVDYRPSGDNDASRSRDHLTMRSLVIHGSDPGPNPYLELPDLQQPCLFRSLYLCFFASALYVERKANKPLTPR